MVRVHPLTLTLVGGERDKMVGKRIPIKIKTLLPDKNLYLFWIFAPTKHSLPQYR